MLVPKPRKVDNGLPTYGLSMHSPFGGLVAEGEQGASPREDFKNQMYLGSDRFLGQMQQRSRDDQPLQENSSRQRRPVARPLTYYALCYASKDRAVAKAFRSGASRTGVRLSSLDSLFCHV